MGVEILIGVGVVVAVALVKTWISYRSNKEVPNQPNDDHPVVKFDEAEVTLPDGAKVKFTGAKVEAMKNTSNPEKKDSTHLSNASGFAADLGGDPMTVLAVAGAEAGITIVKHIVPKAARVFTNIKSTVAGWFGWGNKSHVQDYSAVPTNESLSDVDITTTNVNPTQHHEKALAGVTDEAPIETNAG